ncbi:MAG: family tricarboxylate transporter, receptor protein [Hyphomicrobiales bacterium]|nr:family tricarboxylate transporter, receptor protein [Hyphomicrobiales bacterium]
MRERSTSLTGTAGEAISAIKTHGADQISVSRRGFAQLALGASAFACGAGFSGVAAAQADYYKGRTIQLIVPFSPGGFYDIASRIVARHLPDYIEGRPSIVVQNQPGGGGLSSANRLAGSVPRDGLTIATVSRGIPQLRLVGDPNVSFDPQQLTWLGSLSSYTDDGYLLVVNASHAAKTGEDARRGAPLNLGGVGIGATNTTFALIARDLLGVKANIISGFPGANDVWLAMERGEIDGQVIDLSAIMAARPGLWNQGKLRVLVQFARATRLPSLPDVPTARELVADPTDRTYLEFAESPFFMAMPFAAPPEIPADRAQILQDAFMKMAAAKAFKTEMTEAGMFTSPIDGKAVHDVITEAAKTPVEARERLGKLLIAR